MGKVMGIIKSKYKGSVDLSIAGKILKDKIKINMKYPKSYLEEIKQRLKVSDIVGSKSKTKKKEEKSLLGCHLLKMKKHPRLLLMMKKSFTTVSVAENMETYLILL